jgi:hypothetical protein
MKQTFKSKIGTELILPVAGIFVFTFSIAIINGHGWSMFGIVSPVILFMVPILFGTYYTITGNNLEIRSGFFYYKKINILQIQKIRSSRSWISSPAMSLDRTEIFYNRYDSVLVSPNDQQAFLAALLKVHPGIDVASIQN